VPSDVREHPAPAKKKRGRETAGDMLRSLGVIMVLVLLMWFLAQPPDSDEQPLRTVDPSADVAAFTADVPSAPVPTGLPEQWRSTSSTLGTDSLRIGFVTPDGEYAEYAASALPADDARRDLTGRRAERLDPVQVGGQSWQQFREGDGSTSLVREDGPTLVVVGTKRATATLAELEVLAGSLRTR
jgi:nucleotide-binding universal stress UspA family protein